jgi:hypothetical protein
MTLPFSFPPISPRHPPATRDPSIDAMKALLTLLMILAHTIQFVGNTANRLNHGLSAAGCLLCYPGFLYCFGFGCQTAYFEGGKPPRRRIFASVGRLLVAFYLSAIAFRLFVAPGAVSIRSLLLIMALRDIPQYSEFLLGFALTLLIAVSVFPLRSLPQLPRWLISAMVLLALLSTQGTRNWVRDPWLGLLIGTEQFTAFPVLQYLPLFVMGALVAGNGSVISARMATSGAFCLMAGIAWRSKKGELPPEFPPCLLRILTAGGGAILLHAALQRLPRRLLQRTIVQHVGMNVLFFLLMSNLALFTIAATGKMKSLGPGECAVASLGIVAVTYYLLTTARVARRTSIVTANAAKESIEVNLGNSHQPRRFHSISVAHHQHAFPSRE